ncbi:cardiolipin synthase [Roseomonas sp. CECT 9278]|uniref:cardiolipin synthase n=1 Tax=Roseomonas sp. CECT 9278 TaxID=2845823 RepID=UPI001E555B85|nr:cardiolipin synthase [Roseomonas sp. CECT 9278]CAH0134726.1 Cardiolipin synthase A [Roseomonas sp. CECT 9278]
MLVALHLLAQAAVIIRVLLRPHRNPASRLSWVVVVLAVPVAGMIGYLLLGETNIGRRRALRMQRVRAELPDPPAAPVAIAPRHAPLFRVGQSIGGYAPTGGNRATLAADSNAAIDALVADIDAATDHVHLLFYIWLPDGNGTRVAQALMRAAGRGVACRALVDDIGSKLLIRSALWTAMGAAGVRLARALPVGNPLLRALHGRVDLRNHRKIAVIDDAITWCGSQNCADPEFRIKPRYAPWVDVLLRFEGPVARQNQHLFASDWMAWSTENLAALLARPMPPPGEGFAAQVVASGPTTRHSGMPELFQSLIYAAERELVITTPYYVPDDPLQAALCAAANRGVATTLVLPARNDNWAVGAASRSCYAELLEAGVAIHEFEGGLLHAKTLTLDGEVALVGSANMDRRSFDLNYENTILLADAAATAAIRARQYDFLARSRRVSAAEVAAWPWTRRLWNNAVAVLGPVL